MFLTIVFLQMSTFSKLRRMRQNFLYILKLTSPHSAVFRQPLPINSVHDVSEHYHYTSTWDGLNFKSDICIPQTNYRDLIKKNLILIIFYLFPHYFLPVLTGEVFRFDIASVSLGKHINIPIVVIFHMLFMTRRDYSYHFEIERYNLKEYKREAGIWSYNS